MTADFCLLLQTNVSFVTLLVIDQFHYGPYRQNYVQTSNNEEIPVQILILNKYITYLHLNNNIIPFLGFLSNIYLNFPHGNATNILYMFYSFLKINISIYIFINCCKITLARVKLKVFIAIQLFA